MRRTVPGGLPRFLISALLIGACVGAGLQPTWALPNCTNCGCKAITHWWNQGFTAAARGAKLAGTANDVPQAFSGITTGGGCQAGQQTPVNPACDYWDFTTSNAVCNNAGNVLQECTVTDTGSAVIYGTQHFICQGTE
jgi:hypothetical protein